MNARRVISLLRAHESRNVTHVDPDGTWPIVWERARGAHVWDSAGRKYLDLTAAFGVAAAGHANPRVVRAGQQQMARLLHAMGDVHPHALKARLARELSRITFGRWSRACGKVIFCNSGFEAVEAALKTAILATGRRGILAFTGAYHGLGYGALNATHREHFRGPFHSQSGKFGRFTEFPVKPADLGTLRRELRREFRRGGVGAVIVEPVQARGGIRVPPDGFLPLLRTMCDEHGALLIVDEVYTGFGRTGKWFACEHQRTIPDLVCLGKALTGGFPLSACVGRAELMDRAWPESTGEAIHTSTFLGHPVGCAMALANLHEIRRARLVARSARLGRELLKLLRQHVRPAGALRVEIRGVGLMAGVEVQRLDGSPAAAETIPIIKTLLNRGFIFLPEGEHGNVIGFTPPLVITRPQLRAAVCAVAAGLSRVADPHPMSEGRAP